MTERSSLIAKDAPWSRLMLSAAGAMVLGCVACSSSISTSMDSGAGDSGAVDGGTEAEAAVTKGTGPFVYATVSGDDEVVVIDPKSDQVVDTYAVGGGPALLLGTPGAPKLYTADWQSNSLSAIDTETGKVTSISLSGRPYVIAMSPVGDFVYAGLNPSGIAVIDTKTDTVARKLTTSDLAASLIVSPDGKTLYVATLGVLGGGDLRAIDTKTGEEVHPRIAVGRSPAWITIQPDGSRVYTLNFLSDDISVVDTKTWQVIETVSTGKGSLAIIGNVTPDGKTLYVTNHGTAELMGIDTESYEIVQTVKLTGRPVGVQFDRQGSTVYVTDFGPESLKASPDVTYLLSGNLTSKSNGQVSAYDRKTGKLVGKPVSVGPGPTSVVGYLP